MRYTIQQYAPGAYFLNEFSALSRLSYARKVGVVGSMVALMPRGKLNYEDFGVGQILEIWREKHGVKQLQNETAYFLRNWEMYQTPKQEWMIKLEAWDLLYLMANRIVAYAIGSAKGTKTGYATNVLKEIVYENLGAGCTDTDRILPNFEVAADTDDGPTITKAIGGRNVLEVCNEIVEDCRSQGTYVAFDIARVSPGVFEFQTFVGQRGQDHGRDSNDVRLVGQQYGNLSTPSIYTVHKDEVNYVYADPRDLAEVEVSDDDRINAGYPWNRNEVLIDPSSAETQNEVTAEANAELNRGRPRQTISGKIEETKGLQYGFDFGFGDVLAVEVSGYSVDCHADTANLRSWDPKNGEVLDIRVEGDLL